MLAHRVSSLVIHGDFFTPSEVPSWPHDLGSPLLGGGTLAGQHLERVPVEVLLQVHAVPRTEHPRPADHVADQDESGACFRADVRVLVPK